MDFDEDLRNSELELSPEPFKGHLVHVKLL